MIEKKMEMDLLWENASPTSTFAVQTLTFDDGYDIIEITARYSIGYTSPAFVRFHRNDKVTRKLLSCVDGANTSRYVTVTWVDNKINVAFEIGSRYGGYNASRTDSGEYAVPTHIWGIKGVQ